MARITVMGVGFEMEQTVAIFVKKNASKTHFNKSQTGGMMNIHGNYDRQPCERCASPDGFWYKTVPNLTPHGAYLCGDCYYYYVLLNEDVVVSSDGTVYAGGLSGPPWDEACCVCECTKWIVTVDGKGWCRRCIEENNPEFWDRVEHKVKDEFSTG